jgi:hypothetical protein
LACSSENLRKRSSSSFGGVVTADDPLTSAGAGAVVSIDEGPTSTLFEGSVLSLSSALGDGGGSPAGCGCGTASEDVACVCIVG